MPNSQTPEKKATSFSTKEKDEETQYSYFGARYYNSDISLWLSVDPMADKYPNMSPYMYCAGNPVILVDPDGREIKVTEIMQENGRTLVTITFTGKIINKSSKDMTTDKLNDISNNITNQIIESYGKEYENYDVNVVTDIKAINDFSETSASDHLFMIVNNDDSDLKSTEGESFYGASNILGRVAKINVDIIDDVVQLKRTGAHEFGHMSGLEHPNNEKSNIRNDVIKDKNNLMWQSKDSKGINIIQQQIDIILNNFKE